MYSPSIPRKRVFAVLVRWLCRHFVWGPCEDRTTESLRWFIYRSADIVSKRFFRDITFRNCPITACVASGKASVSGLASLLKEDGTFFALAATFVQKLDSRRLLRRLLKIYIFFILTNRLLKIYTYAVAQPTLTEITLFFPLRIYFKRILRLKFANLRMTQFCIESKYSTIYVSF